MEVITKLDIKNGYISVFNTAEIALLKDREKGVDIIAIQIGMCGAGSTCGAMNKLMYYNRITKCWEEKDSLLPEGYTHEALYQRNIDKDICPYYKLPQNGLVIEICDENTKSVIDKIVWRRSKFEPINK